MVIKAVLRDESDYYSDIYGVPIEIFERKNYRYVEVAAKINRIVALIPDQAEIIFPETERDILIKRTLEELLNNAVNKFEHMYSDTIEQVSSPSDLKRLASQWANRMGCELPSIRMGDAKGRWGSFGASYKNPTGTMMLHEFLKYVPVDLAEEVIVHEMTHALQWKMWLDEYGFSQAARISSMNDHNSDFWKIFGRFMPDHEQRKNELEDYYESIYKKPPPEDG